MMIDCNGDHENARCSMRFSCESDSNETEQSDIQQERQFEPRISVRRGMTIGRNEGHENASDSMRLSCESDSNEIEKSEAQ
jgi:hypothetical protein